MKSLKACLMSLFASLKMNELICNLYALSRARERKLDGIYRMKLFEVKTVKKV